MHNGNVFSAKPLEKAYFIVKMSGPAMVQPASSVVHCSNTECSFSSYHLSCLKLSAKELDVPFVTQRLTISKVTRTIVMADGITKKAFNLDTAICVCNQAKASDKRHKLMECHNSLIII